MLFQFCVPHVSLFGTQCRIVLISGKLCMGALFIYVLIKVIMSFIDSIAPKSHKQAKPENDGILSFGV